MKTIDYLRHYIPVVTISLVLIASAFVVRAEDRHKKESRENEHERNRNEYRSPGYHHEETARNEWNEHLNRDRNDEDYKYRGNHNEYHPKYYSNHHHAQPDYFNHPKYGRVYQRFEHNPIVFETRGGNYYYSGNNFYRYHEGIGYCVVEPPSHIYFRRLPFECRRVYLNGEVFFSNGSLFFQYSPKGYVLVPSPLELRFTARF
jgi:hypothetical protein